MLNIINNNQNFKHFLLYCVTFIVYGSIITALGPLIPYFSQKQGISETSYSILFFSRAVGYFLMAICLRILQKYLNLHQLIIIGIIGAGIGFSVFAYCQTIFWKCFFVFFGSFSSCIVQISINVAMLVAHTNNNQQFWVQISHGVFGIGGLIGPFIVYIFQLNSFLFMALGMVAPAPFYYFLQSPQKQKTVDIEQIVSQRYSQNKVVIEHLNKQKQYHLQGIQIVKNQKDKKKMTQGVPKIIQIYLSVAFFLYIGLQTAYGGWISSYAVLQHVSTKQKATSYSSFFWISITVFRFVFAFLGGKISTKIKNSIYICFLVLIISIIFVFMQQYKWAVYISSIGFGIGIAPLFPLFFTIPGQFEMELRVSQSANICLCASLGQAFLSMAIGFLMGIFTPNMMFYGLLIFTIMLYILNNKMMSSFHQLQSNKNDNPASNLEEKQLDQYFIKKSKIKQQQI